MAAIARIGSTWLVLGLAGLLTTALVSGQAIGETEQKKLVEDFLRRDGTSDEDMRRRDEILEKLAGVPELKQDQEKRWRQEIQKLWSKGKKLDAKSGRHFFWDKPERGLYIVGGELDRPKGLLIAMHGGGAGAGDAGSAQSAFEGAAKKLGWVAIFPEVLEKTEHGWTDAGTEEWVVELVAAARRTWKIDPNHVFFTGHSMGGFGTWTLGAHHADAVAALAPSAGAPTPILERDKGIVDIADGVIPNLRNTKIVIYQSSDDPQVPPDTNRVASKKLDEAQAKWGGFPHEYWEVKGQGHDLAPGGSIALLTKIADAVRDPRPTKLVWQPALRWKRHFGWLWWDKPSTQTTVVVEVDKQKNLVRVECKEPKPGLEVLLDERLVDFKKEVVVMLGEKEVFRGTPKRTLATLLKTAARGDPELVFPAAVSVTGNGPQTPTTRSQRPR